MHKKIVFPVALLFCLGALWGQQTNTLTGTVTDGKSTSIPKASVYVLNTNYGTLTNEQGKFELDNLKPGKYIISISADGG